MMESEREEGLLPRDTPVPGDAEHAGASYEPPAVTDLGSVADLTLGGIKAGKDTGIKLSGV